jgi:hypothetical protein
VFQPPEQNDFDYSLVGDYGADQGYASPWVYLQHPGLLMSSPVAIILIGFWVWMLVHCARHDPERHFWLWILFIGNVPAAVIYFLVRWLPGASVSSGGGALLGRWTKRRQIPRLEAAARNIGNPHQFVELAEALRETGKLDRAADWYTKALSRDADYLPALWGAAQLEMARKNYSQARVHLERILQRDGEYKFGDVSLVYCRALCVLRESDTARGRLEQHLKRWTHPEAYVLLATLLMELGELGVARQHLESMLLDLTAGPAYFARQNRAWARQAKRLLRKLPT